MRGASKNVNGVLCLNYLLLPHAWRIQNVKGVLRLNLLLLPHAWRIQNVKIIPENVDNVAWMPWSRGGQMYPDFTTVFENLFGHESGFRESY